MVQQVSAPTGYVTLYGTKAEAIARRDQIRDAGRLAEAFGPASKVLVAENYGDGSNDFTATSGGGVYVVIAALIKLP